MLNECLSAANDVDECAKSGFRHARPRPGRSLGALIMSARAPIRSAVSSLLNGCTVEPSAYAYVSEATVVGPGAVVEEPAIRLAWFVANIAVAYRAFEPAGSKSSIRDALDWFGGGSFASEIAEGLSPASVREAEACLSILAVDDVLLDLYPYIVEADGHVSRGCLSAASGQSARSRKKADGVYYTPSDVAEFMVQELAGKAALDASWIDPACGTGVFLRSVLLNAKRANSNLESLAYVRNHVFGIDRSALATDSAAFVLLTESFAGQSISGLPLNAWRALKRNIVCMDSLALRPCDYRPDLFTDKLGPVSLKELFPNTTYPITHLVMNPPYAAMNQHHVNRGAWSPLTDTNSKIDLHLAFMEMMWRLEGIEAAAAVLPLSVATNSTRAYSAARRRFFQSAGMKEMLFFDREPQALFGEDIKTRNAITFRFAELQPIAYTSGLLKWTAVQRPGIFTRNRLVRFEADCGLPIPKLGTAIEARYYSDLESKFGAGHRNLAISRISLEALVNTEHFETSFAVGSTAYNFLNIFFARDLAAICSNSDQFSSAPAMLIKCDDEETANAAYAVLASRLTFWLWRVLGDGFHLTAEFVRQLPFWTVLDDQAAKSKLAELGRLVRTEATLGAVRSLNSGKATYSFYCPFTHVAAKSAESILLNHFFGSEDFSEELNRFELTSISLDGKVRRINAITTRH